MFSVISAFFLFCDRHHSGKFVKNGPRLKKEVHFKIVRSPTKPVLKKKRFSGGNTSQLGYPR